MQSSRANTWVLPSSADTFSGGTDRRPAYAFCFVSVILQGLAVRRSQRLPSKAQISILGFAMICLDTSFTFRSEYKASLQKDQWYRKPGLAGLLLQLQDNRFRIFSEIHIPLPKFIPPYFPFRTPVVMRQDHIGMKIVHQQFIKASSNLIRLIVLNDFYI